MNIFSKMRFSTCGVLLLLCFITIEQTDGAGKKGLTEYEDDNNISEESYSKYKKYRKPMEKKPYKNFGEDEEVTKIRRNKWLEKQEQKKIEQPRERKFMQDKRNIRREDDSKSDRKMKYNKLDDSDESSEEVDEKIKKLKNKINLTKKNYDPVRPNRRQRKNEDDKEGKTTANVDTRKQKTSRNYGKSTEEDDDDDDDTNELQSDENDSESDELNVTEDNNDTEESEEDAASKFCAQKTRKGRKTRNGNDDGNCSDTDENTSEDDDDSIEVVSKKQVKYSTKFAHEKNKNKPNKVDSIMRIHREQKYNSRKNRFNDDDSESSEEDTHPKRFRFHEDEYE